MEVFKFQVDMTGTSILVYNEGRTCQGQFPASAQLLEAMAYRNKAYFYCTPPEGSTGDIKLIKAAPEQNW